MPKQKESAVLSSADGAFQCTPDHAVELAYAFNQAEFCMASPKVDRFDVAETLLAYIEGRESIEETIAGLKEIAASVTSAEDAAVAAPAAN